MQSLTKPISTQIEITDLCNLKCRHCYHLDFDCKINSHDVSDDQVMLMATKLVESQVFSVVITGGEPLIRKSLTRQLVAYLKGCNIDVSLNTNLQLLDTETLDNFVANRLDGMLISCPATDPEIYRIMTGGGDVSRFLDKLKLVVDHKQHFSVNMVVNRRNLGHIRQTAKSLHNMGVKIFGATPMGLNAENPDLENLLNLSDVRTLVEELVWVRENLGMEVDIFEALPKCAFSPHIRKTNLSFLNRKCQAGKTIISVANNGDVRPCSHNPAVYGNILYEHLTVIWQRMNEWRDFQTVPNRCQDCKMLANCFGGCRITAKACTGDCRGEDPWMDSPILIDDRPTRIKPEISPYPEMRITFSETFRWRQEAGDGSGGGCDNS